ncbi:Dus-domain-containing protein [Ramicandelaber brevisporus]|nr:Dus-domain-containing protein [Ramicandelaber brevisporus]
MPAVESEPSATMQNEQQMERPRKLKGYDFFRNILGSPRFIVAPMVDQSELPWRILARRYGAQLCYTPMFHARMFTEPQNEQYRRDVWSTCAKLDRPLVVQFCANDADILLKAALMVQDHCDAVDINLGCPQGIAKRGRYGSFLQDEWELIAKMVSTLNEHLDIPVTCKIRVFPDPERTVAYAKMIEAAGCQMLTVHGRTREQKGHNTGLADWAQIKRVREVVKIPMLSNGNILYGNDIDRAIEATGADGAMVSETHLCNPAVFVKKNPVITDIAREYLEIAGFAKPKDQGNAEDAVNTAYPTILPHIRAHMFKLLLPALSIHTDIREKLGRVGPDGFAGVVEQLDARLREEMKTAGDDGSPDVPEHHWPMGEDGVKRVIPHWRCQPYIRPPLPPQHFQKKDTAKDSVEPDNDAAVESSKRAAEEAAGGDNTEAAKRSRTSDTDGTVMSHKERVAAAKAKSKPTVNKCIVCQHHIAGKDCARHSCRQCCRQASKDAKQQATQDGETLDVNSTQLEVVCESHMDKREKKRIAKAMADQEEQAQSEAVAA